MNTTIPIPLPLELAQLYNNATPEEQRKVQWLFETLLKDMFKIDEETLRDVVHDISHKAQVRGLTPEILEELLRDE